MPTDHRFFPRVGIFMDRYDVADAATLNVFYTGEVVGGRGAAGSDAVDLQWFAVDEIPQQVAFACNREAIRAWKATLRAVGE